MSFFPRTLASEFAPIFRLMDDYASQVAARGPTFGSQIQSFQPKFDVREHKDSFELQGELPGVQRDNLTIEFTDHNTLTIQGRTETVREEGAKAKQIDAVSPTAAIQASDTISNAASEDSTNYHKASVEDEDGETSSSTAGPSSQEVQKTQSSETAQAQPETSRYWVSERSVGTFARSFQFPSRVDHDNVKASLSNGILSIVIPKSSTPKSRRINVE